MTSASSVPTPVGSWSWLADRARWFVCALLVTALGSSANADQSAMAALLKRLDLVGYRAGTLPPPFSSHTLEARPISMMDLRGKVILVNFWATWCLECRPEMSVLERLHREFAARGLAVIGINAREATDTVRRYASELGLTFPLVLDPTGTINTLYGVVGLPTTFIVGRDGRAVALGVGPREWGSPPARAIIEALLAEPTPPSGVR